MITLIHGKGVGSGKSYWIATELLANHFRKGGTAYVTESVGLRPDKWENMKSDLLEEGYALKDEQLNIFETDNAASIFQTIKQGTMELPVVLVIDEAQGPLNARDWADPKKRAFFEWLCQSRHDDVDVYISTQHLDNVDKQIRRIITEIHTTQDMDKVRLMGFIKYKSGTFQHSVWTPDYKLRQSTVYIPKNKKRYRWYDTKAMRGKHRDKSEVATKVEVKIKKKMKLSNIAILIVLVLIVLGTWAYNAGKRVVAPIAKVQPAGLDLIQPGQSQTQLVQAKSGQATPPRFRISTDLRGRPPVIPLPATVTETFLGTDSVSFLRTDKATYHVGDASEHGVCVAIRYRQALHRRLDGGHVLVVAQDSTKTISSK